MTDKYMREIDRQCGLAPDTDEGRIAEVEEIRSRNNVCWMKILQLALKYAPAQAKAILDDINQNDDAVGVILKELAKS